MAEIKLFNRDCIAAMKDIEDGSIDLIVTDPPYNLGNFMKNRDTNLHKMRDNFFATAGWDDMEFDEWTQSMDAFFESSSRIMKKGGSMIVFMAIIKVETIIQLINFIFIVVDVLQIDMVNDTDFEHISENEIIIEPILCGQRIPRRAVCG